MDVGHIIGGRFRIISLAGTGGMGKVYRAEDTSSGIQVAVKVLSLDAAKYSQRFLREASVMAQLDHANIVGYFDYGHTKTGAPFIVMEWVDGEDLRQRMNRKHVSLDEALQIITGVGDALAFAEKRGVIHRDLKPSNLMLVDGNLNHIKLLDFGIARWRGPAIKKMTKTGISIGTPGYMAPEQSRGDSIIDGRADIYALGCVVYETLVGQRPFQGEDIIKILTKTPIDKPPRVSAHRSDISPDFDDLLADMMAFQPDERPINGSLMVQRAFSISSTKVLHPPVPLQSGIGTNEKQTLSIILSNQEFPPQTHSLLEALVGMESKVESYDNGTNAIILRSANLEIAEVAKQSVHCALAIRNAHPNIQLLAMLVISDWNDPRELRSIPRESTPWFQDALPHVAGPPVWTDRATALFIHEEFAIAPSEEARTKLFKVALPPSELASLSQEQTLFPQHGSLFVGRKEPLQKLTSHWEAAVTTATFTSVLLTGPTGIGKSRIQKVFTNSLLTSKGIPFANSAARHGQSDFAIIGQFVTHLAGLQHASSLSEKRKALQTHMELYFGNAQSLHIASFLGEACKVPFVADSNNPALIAARGNAAMMEETIVSAWAAYIKSYAEKSPLLLVVEDFQYADTASQKALQRLHKSSSQAPCLLLVLSRNAIETRAFTPQHQMHLGPLEESGCNEIAKSWRHKSHLDSWIQEQIDLAQGNPFILKELLTQEGSKTIPLSIQAIFNEQLRSCPSHQRRFLRAASILGPVFNEDAIQPLLGENNLQGNRETRIQLQQAQLIRSQDKELRFSFRSELYQRCVHESLSKEDITIGHKLAAQWEMKKFPESASMDSQAAYTIATHWERAEHNNKASSFFAYAAIKSLNDCDLFLAEKYAQRGLALCEKKTMCGNLRLIQSEVALWNGINGMACEHGLIALEEFEEHSSNWLRAAGVAIVGLGRCDAIVDILPLAQTLSNGEDKAVSSLQIKTIAKAATSLFQAGHYSEAMPLYSMLPAPNDTADDVTVNAKAHLFVAHAHRQRSNGDLSRFYDSVLHSSELFEQSNDHKELLLAHISTGVAHSMLGEWERAEHLLRTTLTTALTLRVGYAHALASSVLGGILLAMGRHSEAESFTQSALGAFTQQSNEAQELLARVQLAEIYTKQGKLEQAESEVQSALGGISTVETVRMLANVQLSSVYRYQNRAPEALRCAQLAYDLFVNPRQVKEGEARVSLALVQALLQNQQQEKAKAALTAALSSLQWRLQRIAGQGQRQKFLEEIPEHKQILELAASLGLANHLLG